MNFINDLYELAKKIQDRKDQNDRDRKKWQSLGHDIRKRSQEISLLNDQLVSRSLKKK